MTARRSDLECRKEGLFFIRLLDSPRRRPYTPRTNAGVAELADAQDSGSCEVHSSCGFKSLLRYREQGVLWDLLLSVLWEPP